ncbi:unnamed protein product [Phytophthora fragariaefolia]|uniref:Unnamed protein product n=1 Tax=Phytophthora fragariaefolia TaxID=1490495 RepID=A0A9W6Y4Y5_9STRA|nr:unnamed protein product [Phytophthora fragariaefolia]
MPTEAALARTVAFLPTSAAHQTGTDIELVGSLLSKFAPQQVTPDTSTSSSVKSETQLAATGKTRREKEKIRKRVYHQRLKSEREILRKMVSDLSRQLEGLQNADNIRLVAKEGMVNSTWRDVALKQRGRRVQAETEQMQLFAMAKKQASIIKSLCEKLPSGELLSPGHVWGASPSINRPLFDESMYDSLIAGANACYAQIDEVLLKFYQDGVTTSEHRNPYTGEIEYFQHLNQFTEPYDYEPTNQTMWRLANLLHREQDRQEFHELGNENDTIVIRFRLLRTLTSGARVSVLQRYVQRRFQEARRTILVWKTLSEGEGVFHGINSEETGWLCLQPSNKEDSTLVRVCVRQVPLSYQTPRRCDSKAVAFHKVMQTSVSEDMQEISSALDKMLLDETLEGIDI